MKVIVAGSPKTGTKSMNAALTELGYRVYDYMDHLFYHSDDWMKIFEGKGGAEDFKRMYENIDAVVDMPACFYWEEIHKVFPDAKVSLIEITERTPKQKVFFFCCCQNCYSRPLIRQSSKSG